MNEENDAQTEPTKKKRKRQSTGGWLVARLNGLHLQYQESRVTGNTERERVFYNRIRTILDQAQYLGLDIGINQETGRYRVNPEQKSVNTTVEEKLCQNIVGAFREAIDALNEEKARLNARISFLAASADVLSFVSDIAIIQGELRVIDGQISIARQLETQCRQLFPRTTNSEQKEGANAEDEEDMILLDQYEN